MDSKFETIVSCWLMYKLIFQFDIRLTSIVVIQPVSFCIGFGCSELVHDLGDLWTKRCPGFFLSSHGRVCVALIGKKMG